MNVPIGIPLLNFNTMKYNGIRSVTLVPFYFLSKDLEARETGGHNMSSAIPSIPSIAWCYLI